LGVGWLGSVATDSARVEWYAYLQRPPFNPPDWIFAPVWTALYILMAIAGWRIWDRHLTNERSLRPLFIIQLVLNGIWSFLFFGMRNPLIALVDITLLWACIFILIKNAWQLQKASAILLIPYLLWVSFALYLNAGIWWLNR